MLEKLYDGALPRPELLKEILVRRAIKASAPR